MAKTITFNVPILGKRKAVKIEQREGQVAHIAIGDTKVKFVLQVNRVTGKVDSLVHYATGYRFGPLRYVSFTPRRAAEDLVARVIAQYGVDKVREAMSSKPVLNS